MNAVIRGTVWVDRDLDRQVDAGEPRLSEVRVELWMKGLLIRVASTLDDGSYRFSHLMAGTYQVVERDPPGYVSFTRNEREVVLLPGQTTVINFADVPEGSLYRTAIPAIVR